jgi:hypothetical protein
MPITLTFDIDEASITDTNDRGRMSAAFARLGWEHIGGSAWRYPALGTTNASEDWLNHVVPALMYFRSLVEHANLNITKFTIDAHSEAGYRVGNPPVGAMIQHSHAIRMYAQAPDTDVLSEQRLRTFVADAATSLE